MLLGRGRPAEVILVACALACCASSLSADDAGETLFRNQVAPLLQKHCFACHNDTEQKGDFSLETRAGLLESGMLEAGDPAASPLMDMIVASGDEPAVMPKDREPLSAAEVRLIGDWIQLGAPWPDDFSLRDAASDLEWWSYKPVARPAVPTADDKGWSRTPIDRFIFRRLAEHKLAPSPEANRRTLIRRLSYDLTGLPPSMVEIERFINDPAVDAYDQLVDRLLASPAYGERWARHWLDVVKYADTCGYDKDKLRPNAWPYRDYVIRSFNQDKPYTRFVHEQLAGDVLFPGTADGILGLGFIAAGPWDFIGHVEVPETKIDGRIARHIDRDEMVTNTFNTFCSVTIQCARCHNHKFDAITQRHYYNLQTVFAAVDRANRLYDADPAVQAKRQQLESQLAQQELARSELEAGIRADGGEQLIKLEKQHAALLTKAGLKDKNPAFGYHSAIVPSATTSKWVQLDLAAERQLATIVLRPCHDEFNGIGAGFGFPLRFRVEASNDPAFKQGVVTISDQTGQDLTNPGLAAWKVKVEEITARYLRITATQLAERKADYIFALAEVEVLDTDGTHLARGAAVTALDSIEAPVRWQRANLTDGIFAEANDPAAALELIKVGQQLDEIRQRVYTPARQAALDTLAQQVSETGTQIAALPAGRMVYAAATSFKVQGGFQPTNGTPRSIHLLHRGNILAPREPSVPGTIPLGSDFPIEFQLPEDHSEGDRRAILARWITRPDHPLTWRSIVNRVWHYHFGQGIAASPNDLGRMGQLPSHPQLLDWLASEFRDGGQSIKQLHRLIVTSAVYRQSSAHRPAAAKLDGGNQLLWRMNRRRLEAEEIRDSVLAVSGRLQQKMYGPGYYLFVLEKTDHSPHYEYYKFDPSDPASQRRSIYRFIVRSQPDPFMTTLDCADSSQSTPRRNETLTSLQALSLLNNRFNLVMAENFALGLAENDATLDDQVRTGFERVTGRAAGPDEYAALLEYARQHGMANTCRLLLNLSEFVFLD